MLIRALKQMIADLPDDYRLNLTRGFVVRETDVPEPEAGPSSVSPENVFELIFDTPVVGLVINDDGEEVRIILEANDSEMKALEKYGTVLPWKRTELS